MNQRTKTISLDAGTGQHAPIRVRLAPANEQGPRHKKAKAKKTKRGGLVNTGARDPVALPRVYHTTTDTMCLQLKTTASILNDSVTAGLVSRAIALTPIPISTTNYSSLGTYFPVLAGLRTSYARFMISRLKVTLLCTSPYTSGGFLAANFEADSTGVSGPPGTLSDVTNALHSCVGVPGDSHSYVCNVAEYFNDWRNAAQASNDPDDIVDAGLIQIYGNNSSATGVGVGLLTLEVDFYFSGYRSLS